MRGNVKGLYLAENWNFERLPIFCLQEISWHRLDDLQPVSGDVISRGLSGVKLYMVAPFLLWVLFTEFWYDLQKGFTFLDNFYSIVFSCRSLKSWISAHQPHIAPKFDAPAKGLSFHEWNFWNFWHFPLIVFTCDRYPIKAFLYV